MDSQIRPKIFLAGSDNTANLRRRKKICKAIILHHENFVCRNQYQLLDYKAINFRARKCGNPRDLPSPPIQCTMG